MGKQFTVANGFFDVRYSLANPKNYNAGDTVVLTDNEYAALPTSLTRTVNLASVTTVADPTYPSYPFFFNNVANQSVFFVQPSGDKTGKMDLSNINKALTTYAGNTIVKLCGTYYVNGTIVTPGGTYLDGYNSYIFVVNGTNYDAVIGSPAALTTGTGVTYDAPITIAGVMINGNRANQTAGKGNGILLGAGSNSAPTGPAGGQTTFKDCVVFEVRGTGICNSEVNLGDNGLATGTAAPYTGESRYLNNRVYSCGAQGIWQRGGGLGGAAAHTDGFMLNNIVGYCTHDGIRVDSSGGWLIAGNHPYGTGLSGILIQGAYSTRVEDNYIEGIGVLDSAATHFSTSSAFSQATTYAAGTTYAINNIVIYNNVIYRSRVDNNTGNQPDISPTQWAAYAGGQNVSGLNALGSNSARGLTAKGNQISLGHASWSLNSNFQYNGIYVQGPTSGTSKATVWMIGNDISNELQGAGTNTTAIRLAGAGAGPSGINPIERDNQIRGSWNSNRNAGSTCAPTGAVGAGASGGTGASITVTGNNQGGTVQVTAGNSGLAAGALATVSYTTTQAVTPRVVVEPRDSASAALGPIYVTTSTTGFTINTSVAPTAAAIYKYDYVAMVEA